MAELEIVIVSATSDAQEDRRDLYWRVFHAIWRGAILTIAALAIMFTEMLLCFHLQYRESDQHLLNKSLADVFAFACTVAVFFVLLKRTRNPLRRCPEDMGLAILNACLGIFLLVVMCFLLSIAWSLPCIGVCESP